MAGRGGRGAALLQVNYCSICLHVPCSRAIFISTLCVSLQYYFSRLEAPITQELLLKWKGIKILYIYDEFISNIEHFPVKHGVSQRTNHRAWSHFVLSCEAYSSVFVFHNGRSNWYFCFAPGFIHLIFLISKEIILLWKHHLL